MSTKTNSTTNRIFPFCVVTLCAMMAGCNAASQPTAEVAEQRQDVARMETELSQLRDAVPERKRLLQRIDSFSKSFTASAVDVPMYLRSRDARRALQAELAKWTEASYVIGNDNTSGVAAILEDEKGAKVVAYAVHPFQKFVLQAVTQASVPTRADARSETLLAHIKIERDRVATFPFPLTNGFGEIADDLTKFMVFRDAQTDMQKVAIFVEEKGVRAAKTVDNSSKALADVALVSGSYWQGKRAEIEPQLEAGAPFLDYCVLSVAEMLEMSRFKRGNVAISLIVGADAQFQKQFKPKESRIAAGYLPHEKGSQSMSFARQGRESLELVMKQIQDDLAGRLAAQKWRLLERRYEGLVRSEDIRKNRELAGKYSSQASHLVVVELAQSQEGRDSISVRLLDTKTSDTIWEANDKHTLLPNRNWKKYLLRSGDPVLVHFKSPAARSSYFAHLQKTQNETQSNDSTALVAIREEVDGDRIALRSPFGTKTWTGNASDVVITPIPTAVDSDMSLLFEDDLKKAVLPFMAYRFARHTLPLATRVTLPKEFDLPLQLQLGVGSAERLSPGARFRLQFADPDGETRLNQPFLGVVHDVNGAHSARLFVPDMPALSSRGAANGIAICDSTPRTKCAVYFPWVIPQSGIARTAAQQIMKGNMLAEHLQTMMIQNCAEHFECGKGVYEFRNPNDRERADWFLKFDNEKTSALAAENGITHLIVGKIKATGKGDFHVWLGLQELSKNANGKWAPGNVLDSAFLTLDEKDF